MNAEPTPEPDDRRAPLVIVGPTASGKSGLALALAKRTSGVEIVSADAMAVYRGMDIGTAKPSRADRSDVPHHLIDVVDPVDTFDLGHFVSETRLVLDDIHRRGRRAVLVGGTGLYVQAIVDDLDIPGQYAEIRAGLDAEPDDEATTVELWKRLQGLDPVAADKIVPNNRRRIVRALEVTLGSGRPFSSFGPGMDAYPPTRFVQVGLEIDRASMDARIEQRYRDQMKGGFLDEVRRIFGSSGSAGSVSRTAAQALGYKELADHLAGRIDLDEAIALADQRTRRFARRQQRWFRRDPRIRWFDALDPDLVADVEQYWVERSDSTKSME